MHGENRGRPETAVLKNVCVDFQDGIFYAVIGKSGSGKSTLLNILSGLDTPDTAVMRIPPRRKRREVE